MYAVHACVRDNRDDDGDDDGWVLHARLLIRVCSQRLARWMCEHVCVFLCRHTSFTNVLVIVPEGMCVCFGNIIIIPHRVDRRRRRRHHCRQCSARERQSVVYAAEQKKTHRQVSIYHTTDLVIKTLTFDFQLDVFHIYIHFIAVVPLWRMCCVYLFYLYILIRGFCWLHVWFVYFVYRRCVKSKQSKKKLIHHITAINRSFVSCLMCAVCVLMKIHEQFGVF